MSRELCVADIKVGMRVQSRCHVEMPWGSRGVVERIDPTLPFLVAVLGDDGKRRLLYAWELSEVAT